MAIDLATASKWIKNYGSGAAPDPVQGFVIKAHFFGREILQEILDQPGSMGIKMYHARDEKGQRQLVLVGADADCQDMTEGIIADGSSFCPPMCSSGELNG